MTTVVTGLAATLSLDSKSYIAGLNAAAIATQQAQSKMMRSYASAAAAANATTAAVTRQATAAQLANQRMVAGMTAAGMAARRQATVVGQANNTIRGSFASTGSSIDGMIAGLRRIFYAGIALQGARAVLEYGDAWTEAGNKIRAAESIAGVHGRSLSMLNDIATATRSPLEDIADLYAKLIRTSSGVVESEQKIADMTQTVAEAFKAGGASTLEQVNGIRQLAQALGSGILQGDELRSLRENAPLLAQAIAIEFNTTIAGLKKLGAEGKLTSDRIAKAIEDGQERIHRAFLQTTPTVGQAFTVLNNALTESVGRFNEATGASKALADGIIWLANNLEEIQHSFSVNLLQYPETSRLFRNIMGLIDDLNKKFAENPDAPNAWSTRIQKAIREAWDQANNLKFIGSALDYVNDKIEQYRGKVTRAYPNPRHGGDYTANAGFGTGIGDEADKAAAAVDKLKASQHDWATQTTVTEAGKLQAEAYKNLADYIKDTETPFETYKKTLAEIAVLERDGALTATQAFTARSQSMLTFANTALGAASAMTGALTQLFKDNKAVAIANAVINTAEAITAALKNPPGPPFSYVYAAAAAVAGAAQIATIVSTNPGSGKKTPTVKNGGGGGAIGATEKAGSASRGGGSKSAAINITLEGEGGFSKTQVRALIGQINEAVGDGASLMVR
jgi:tape measure domain-containing protein